MELKQLQTFKVLARELSFTRTAELVGYAQSSVTAQIQSLEQELQVRLFERLGKRVLLTDAGMRLQSYADEMLRLAREAVLAVSTQSTLGGTLTIGAVESLCTYRLAPVLSHFRTTHPQVNLIFRTGVCAELRKGVLHGDLDLAFTLEDESAHESLCFEVVTAETMLVLATPGHPLVDRMAVTPADLAAETILVTEPGCSYRTMFEQALTDAGLANQKIEFASVEAIKQCVMVGLGVALLPEMTVREEVLQGQLTALPWSGPDFAVMTQMCWHKSKWMSVALRAFIDVARQVVPQ